MQITILRNHESLTLNVYARHESCLGYMLAIQIDELSATYSSGMFFSLHIILYFQLIQTINLHIATLVHSTSFLKCYAGDTKHARSIYADVPISHILREVALLLCAKDWNYGEELVLIRGHFVVSVVAKLGNIFVLKSISHIFKEGHEPKLWYVKLCPNSTRE